MIKHNLDLYKVQTPIRRIAYREFGDVNSENILLCIPGILESQNAFDEIVNFVEQHEGCRLITVDHCGRGKSDLLDEGSNYKMSVYLEDLRTLITHLHATHKRLSRRLYLLGSSMGGLLALNLAGQQDLRVKGLILNDVGLTISWNGLFNLYSNKDSESTDSPDEAIRKIRFDPRLIEAIRRPGHVDIRYRLNFLGLHFDNGLQDFKGPVLLLRSKNSDICTSIDEQFLMNTQSMQRLFRLKEKDILLVMALMFYQSYRKFLTFIKHQYHFQMICFLLNTKIMKLTQCWPAPKFSLPKV